MVRAEIRNVRRVAVVQQVLKSPKRNVRRRPGTVPHQLADGRAMQLRIEAMFVAKRGARQTGCETAVVAHRVRHPPSRTEAKAVADALAFAAEHPSDAQCLPDGLRPVVCVPDESAAPSGSQGLLLVWPAHREWCHTVPWVATVAPGAVLCDYVLEPDIVHFDVVGARQSGVFSTRLSRRIPAVCVVVKSLMAHVWTPELQAEHDELMVMHPEAIRNTMDGCRVSRELRRWVGDTWCALELVFGLTSAAGDKVTHSCKLALRGDNGNISHVERSKHDAIRRAADVLLNESASKPSKVSATMLGEALRLAREGMMQTGLRKLGEVLLLLETGRPGAAAARRVLIWRRRAAQVRAAQRGRAAAGDTMPHDATSDGNGYVSALSRRVAYVDALGVDTANEWLANLISCLPGRTPPMRPAGAVRCMRRMVQVVDVHKKDLARLRQDFTKLCPRDKRRVDWHDLAALYSKWGQKSGVIFDRLRERDAQLTTERVHGEVLAHIIADGFWHRAKGGLHTEGQLCLVEPRHEFSGMVIYYQGGGTLSIDTLDKTANTERSHGRSTAERPAAGGSSGTASVYSTTPVGERAATALFRVDGRSGASGVPVAAPLRWSPQEDANRRCLRWGGKDAVHLYEQLALMVTPAQAKGIRSWSPLQAKIVANFDAGAKLEDMEQPSAQVLQKLLGMGMLNTDPDEAGSPIRVRDTLVARQFRWVMLLTGLYIARRNPYGVRGLSARSSRRETASYEDRRPGCGSIKRRRVEVQQAGGRDGADAELAMRCHDAIAGSARDTSAPP